MEAINTNPIINKSRLRNYFVVSAILVIAILVGFSVFRSFASPQGVTHQPRDLIVSQNVLEEQSGLRITLLAVTAAGGMVDFRFKVVDVEKAKKVLQDGKLLPFLNIVGSSVSLKPAPETLQDIKLENGLVYYILYSNTGNQVKPGTSVSVVIGDWKLEPIIAK
jgi:hypothetical protein